jgi:hypothetical protein
MGARRSARGRLAGGSREARGSVRVFFARRSPGSGQPPRDMGAELLTGLGPLPPSLLCQGRGVVWGRHRVHFAAHNTFHARARPGGAVPRRRRLLLHYLLLVVSLGLLKVAAGTSGLGAQQARQERTTLISCNAGRWTCCIGRQYKLAWLWLLRSPSFRPVSHPLRFTLLLLLPHETDVRAGSRRGVRTQCTCVHVWRARYAASCPACPPARSLASSCACCCVSIQQVPLLRLCGPASSRPWREVPPMRSPAASGVCAQ